MELLTQLDIGATNNFFRTFFSLPDFYWRGFLASSLSSGHLLAFAFLTMIKAPPGIQFKLMKHLIFLSAQTPHASCCAAGLQAKMLDSSAVTTAKLTAAAILMMVLSNQVTTG